MGIPRTLRDFHAGWESRLLDFSTPRLFHGLAGRQFWVEDRTAALVVATEGVRPIAEAQGSIQVSAPSRPACKKTCLPCSPTLAACKADTSLAISTGHIMC